MHHSAIRAYKICRRGYLKPRSNVPWWPDAGQVNGANLPIRHLDCDCVRIHDLDNLPRNLALLGIDFDSFRDVVLPDANLSLFRLPATESHHWTLNTDTGHTALKKKLGPRPWISSKVTLASYDISQSSKYIQLAHTLQVCCMSQH